MVKKHGKGQKTEIQGNINMEKTHIDVCRCRPVVQGFFFQIGNIVLIHFV